MQRSIALRVLAGGVALAALIAGHPSLDAAQGSERVLYVNAFDKATRQPVTGLGPSDIIVREDGVAREVLRVTPATSPMPIALLFDNTQAATPAISDIRRAISAFLTAAQGVGPIALISYADRPTILVDYTTSAKDLESGVGRVFAMPGSGGTLLDAIRETSQGLARRESDRAAIVLLATETVEFSTLHYTQVLDALRTSGAQLHAVVYTVPGASIINDEARNRASVLDRGPRESGGIRVDVLATSAFEEQMRDLGTILRSQYRVIYARPQSLIPPDKVEVSAAKAGVEAQGAPARNQPAKP
jgi:hypothetical protein